MKNFRQKIIHNKVFKDRFFIKEDFWEAEIKNSSFVNCTFLETIFCDVKFEKSCLEFYKSKRPVKTASSEQVRQPMYKTGLDYWDNYSDNLEILIKHFPEYAK